MTWAQAVGLALLVGGTGMWGATMIDWAPLVAAPCTVALVAILFKKVGDS